MTDETVIQVAYADDHKVVRKGIISFINELGGIEVVIEADNGKELIEKIEKSGIIPDVCIVDINMPGMNGFDTTIALKQKWRKIKVLVLTAFEVELYLVRMISYGANGYLLKSCDPDEIKKAIVAIHNDGMYYADYRTRNLVNDVKSERVMLPRLTEGEMQLLNHCCSDLSYGQIAEKIGVTQKSLEGHRDNLCRKLGINSRIGLAMFAMQFGLVTKEINTSVDGNFLKKNAYK